MATAVITPSNVQQNVETDGKRSVEVTLDFDTGDYTTGGLALAGAALLNAIGLKVVDKAYTVSSAHVDNLYTEAEWDASQTVDTKSFFVITTSPDAPLLKIFSADAEHGASAIAASTQVRLRLVGS